MGISPRGLDLSSELHGLGRRTLEKHFTGSQTIRRTRHGPLSDGLTVPLRSSLQTLLSAAWRPRAAFRIAKLIS